MEFNLQALLGLLAESFKAGCRTVGRQQLRTASCRLSESEAGSSQTWVLQVKVVLQINFFLLIYSFNLVPQIHPVGTLPPMVGKKEWRVFGLKLLNLLRW